MKKIAWLLPTLLIVAAVVVAVSTGSATAALPLAAVALLSLLVLPSVLGRGDRRGLKGGASGVQDVRAYRTAHPGTTIIEATKATRNGA
ncbi:hypothetical protein F7P69_25130 [Cellulosimicrobium funkei]|nr:hypothetical protein [Cellulosimicrobium funkei]